MQPKHLRPRTRARDVDGLGGNIGEDDAGGVHAPRRRLCLYMRLAVWREAQQPQNAAVVTKSHVINGIYWPRLGFWPSFPMLNTAVPRCIAMCTAWSPPIFYIVLLDVSADLGSVETDRLAYQLVYQQQVDQLCAEDNDLSHLLGTWRRMLHQVSKVSGSYLYSWLEQL